MRVSRKIPRLFREPPRTLFDDPRYEAFEAPVKGPLVSTPVFYALLAVLMTGIAIPSALLMFHYKRLYSYTSYENIFFAVTFSLSFLLGSPCVLTGIFG